MSKKSYSISFKINAVKLAKVIGNRPAGKELNVDEKRIREWIQQSNKGRFATIVDEIGQSVALKRQRLNGGGCKPHEANVEEELANWVCDQRKNYCRVTRKSISIKALSLSNNLEFKASRGWVDKFLKRNDFVPRQRTTTGQQLPENVNEKLISFINYCQSLRNSKCLRPSDIGNMDETAIWVDMPGNKTIDIKGVKTVPIMTTGHERSRITVCLSAMADGRKLSPFVVFKGKRFPQELKKLTGIVIAFTKNGWMTPETTVMWIKKVWGILYFHPRLLVWDAFRSHHTENVRNDLKSARTTIACIPGGCTKYLQPADVSWNASFKSKYRELYENWLQESQGLENLTSTGKLKAPSKLQMLEWVKEAWNNVSEETIITSFSACGITTSNPDDIHFMKSREFFEIRKELSKSNEEFDDETEIE